MSKVRINDLARELEVKSKAILDVLPLVGATEKKTHSSSLEEHEAELVRKHLGAHAETATTAAKPSRTAHGEEEFKTKIDLSHISRPGDVLRAITQQKEAVEHPPARPVAKPPAPAPAPPAAAKTETPAAPPKPVAPKPAAETPAPRLVTPASVAAQRPPAVVVIPPKAPVAAPAPAAPVASAAPPAVAIPPKPAPPTPSMTPSAAAPPAAPTVEAKTSIAERPAAAPSPRVIMPQTGPRPVYKAPPAPAGGAARPVPGRPVPGQPIFQRPRPQAPTGTGPRPPLRPGERRPMHPTRQSPTGARPLGVGPGAGALPPPGSTRPGSRPGGPARRPGQRYVPRGVKEGPMKGYVPPPRVTISNEPLPITRNITITEGISVKDLAEKLDIRAKDLISRLLARGVFATINQTLDAELASEMARFFGADTNVITFEEQAAKDIDAAAAGEESTAETVSRPPVVTIM